jgi:hypothetical protein
MAFNPIQFLPDIAGGYVLTTRGGLGIYGRDGSFAADDKLSHSLAGLITGFIRQYVQTRETTGWRIGTVHADHQDQPWTSATIAFEDHVLRELYPVRGNGYDQLTAFQTRNREKSLYRGMDLLLSQEEQAGEGLPVYCPVLMYRGQSLREFLPRLGRMPREADAHTPVLEVINLLAGASLSDRCNPAVRSLVTKLRRNLIKPEKRSIPNLLLIDDMRELAHANHAPGQRAASS